MLDDRTLLFIEFCTNLSHRVFVRFEILETGGFTKRSKVLVFRGLDIVNRRLHGRLQFVEVAFRRRHLLLQIFRLLGGRLKQRFLFSQRLFRVLKLALTVLLTILETAKIVAQFLQLSTTTTALVKLRPFGFLLVSQLPQLFQILLIPTSRTPVVITGDSTRHGSRF